MEKFKHSKSEILTPIRNFIAIQTVVAGLLAMEFSEKSRRSIKERANLQSELDPRFKAKFFLMQCAHKDHDRRNPYYNEPDNGILTTVWQHHNGVVGDVRTVNPLFKRTEQGLVDHSMFANEGLGYHFTKEAIQKFTEKYGSTIRLWRYLPPQWDINGMAIGDELGFIARPATWQEREDGICRIEIPLMLNRHDEPTERMRIITFKDILNGKAKTFSKII